MVGLLWLWLQLLHSVRLLLLHPLYLLHKLHLLLVLQRGALPWRVLAGLRRPLLALRRNHLLLL